MSSDGTEQPVVVGARCTADDCDWTPLGTDRPAREWDLIERLRQEHEDDTGHRTTVECYRESRIVPDGNDRMVLGEAVLELAEQRGDRVDWICPECQRSGEELETTKRCPDCDERLREVLPDGGSVDDSEQDIYGTLGDVTECATCPREAAGERVQALEHPDGGKKVWRVHLCRYCNRAFSLGNGDPPLLTDGGCSLSPEVDQ